jgi:hypothetical protein
MKEILDQVDEILKNEVPDRHSFFQLKHFLVGAEPTIQAKLQCCVRELKSRRQTLENITLEMEDVRDQTALLALELEDSTDGELDDARTRRQNEIVRRQLRRKMQRNDRQLVELQKKGRNVFEECQFFVEAYRQLAAEEALKPWDDLDVQQEYWDAKIGAMLRTRTILGQPLDEELVKAALSLGDGSAAREATLALIHAQQEFAAKVGLPQPEAVVSIKE